MEHNPSKCTAVLLHHTVSKIQVMCHSHAIAIHVSLYSLSLHRKRPKISKDWNRLNIFESKRSEPWSISRPNSDARLLTHFSRTPTISWQIPRKSPAFNNLLCFKLIVLLCRWSVTYYITKKKASFTILYAFLICTVNNVMMILKSTSVSAHQFFEAYHRSTFFLWILSTFFPQIVSLKCVFSIVT